MRKNRTHGGHLAHGRVRLSDGSGVAWQLGTTPYSIGNSPDLPFNMDMICGDHSWRGACANPFRLLLYVLCLVIST